MSSAAPPPSSSSPSSIAIPRDNTQVFEESFLPAKTTTDANNSNNNHISSPKKRSLFDSQKSRPNLADNPDFSSQHRTPPLSPTAKTLAHRGKVVEEIISSETVFHQLLVDYNDCFFRVLALEREQASMEFMSRSKLVVLSNNLEQLSLVSGQLLNDLERCVEAAPGRNTALTELGKVFINTSTLLRLFGEYAENHSNAKLDIAAVMSKQTFKDFWARTERESAYLPTTAADMSSYLILPIQRVPRYLLLLRALLEATPESRFPVEHANLTNAVEEVKKAAHYMNDCIVRAEQKETMRVLQSKFVGTVVDFVGGIGPAGYRALELEGELIRITSKGAHKTYHFHLMNDALVYSRVVKTVSGESQFKFHRALALGVGCSVHDVEDGILNENASYLAYTALEPYSRTRSCAFQLRTKDKSFIAYASTLEAKQRWVEAIDRVIQTQVALAEQCNENVPAPTVLIAPPIPASTTTERCQMCQTPFYVFSRRVCCERCNLSICGACGSNFRVLPPPNKQQQQHQQAKPVAKFQALPPVCIACAWEMDGTALDSAPNEFRIKMWVEEVESLLGAVNGGALLPASHHVLATTTPAASTAMGGSSKDSAEALKRVYFSLSFTFDEEEEKEGDWESRGPSNCGTLGVDSAFSIPLGLPSAPRAPVVKLHMYMLGVGEIGTVRIPLEPVLCEEELGKAQQFYQWHVVNPVAGMGATSTLALSLLHESARSATTSGLVKLSDKEKQALKIGLKIRFELHVPPALWQQQQQGGAATTVVASTAPQRQRRRSSSVSSNRPGAAKIMAATSDQPEEIALRLQRYMAIDDAQFMVGGIAGNELPRLQQGENMREKLNVALLNDYEAQVLARPSKWALCLLDILYSDCVAHYRALAKQRPDLYSDTQVTLLNRLAHFHKANSKVLLPYEAETKGAEGVVASRQQQQQQPVTAAAHTRKKESIKETATRNALRGLTTRSNDGQAEDCEDDAREWEQILNELVQTEEGFCHHLQVMDQVFVSRLLLLAQSSGPVVHSHKSRTLVPNSDKPAVVVGGEAAHGAAAFVSKLFTTSPIKSSHSTRFKSSGGTAAATPLMLEQDHVLHWLQSLLQIRMANTDFLAALKLHCNREEEDDDIGESFERFSLVMPVYGTLAMEMDQVLSELESSSDGALSTILATGRAEAGHSFAHYLKLVLLRVEHYSKALAALLMLAKPGSRAFTGLCQALSRVVDTTQGIARAQRKRENAKRLSELEREVDQWPPGFVLNPPQQHQRWLVREGWLQEEPHKQAPLPSQKATSEAARLRYVLLFSDCIVFATPVTKRKKTMHMLKQTGQEILFGIQSSPHAAAASAAATTQASASKRKFRFQQMIWLKQHAVMVRDLPNSQQEAIPTAHFALYSGEHQHLVTLSVPLRAAGGDVELGPNAATTTTRGPAATDAVRAKLKQGKFGAEASQAMDVFQQTKLAWMEDIALCCEMAANGLVFDEDHHQQQRNTASFARSSSKNLFSKRSFKSTSTTATGSSSSWEQAEEDESKPLVMDAKQETVASASASAASLCAAAAAVARAKVDSFWMYDPDYVASASASSKQQGDVEDGRTCSTRSTVSSSSSSQPRDSLVSSDLRSVYKYSVSSLDDMLAGVPPPSRQLAKSVEQQRRAPPVTPLRKVSMVTDVQPQTAAGMDEQQLGDVEVLDALDFEML